MANLDDLLLKTSRTFALSIPMLPSPLVATSASRICFSRRRHLRGRIALAARAGLAALDDLARLLATRGGEQDAAARWLADAPVAHAGYVELLRESPAVMEAYWSVPEPARAVLRRELLRTVSGMAGFVRCGDPLGNLRLASLRELRDYCYVVAGIVGEMLTELFLLDAEAIVPVATRLRRRSRFFGEALQLVNILKDAGSDATEGRVYLPPESIGRECSRWRDATSTSPRATWARCNARGRRTASSRLPARRPSWRERASTGSNRPLRERS
jgi:farnesyl-diphosphate farnesyltransferase